MMKRSLLFLFLLFGAIAYGQSSTTATFSGGDLNTDFNATPTTSSTTVCPDTITINIPAGDNVTGVDVSYDMTAQGGGWRSDQRSYLRCVTTSTSEATLSLGGPNTPGVESYNRTNLNIANGISATGELKFVLYGMRVWGGTGLNCNNQFQIINNNSWTITVHHGPAPTCPAPTAVTLNSVTANTANVGWTTGGATDWEVEYGLAGFTPGTGTRLSSTTNPFTITGLSASTSYDVYVRDSCALGDVSFWTGPLNVNTTCGIVTAPYVENFDNSTWVPGAGLTNAGNLINLCWTRNNLPGTYHWGTMSGSTPSANTGPTSDNTTGAGKYIYTEASSLGGPATIETPEIDLSTLNVPEMTFWYHMFGTAIGTLRVDIHDGNTWTNGVFTLTGFQQSTNTDPWLEATVNLSAYANDTIKVRFHGTRGANFLGDIAIDDLDIHEQPTCPKPSNLAVTLRSANSIELSWTTGSATNWNIEYGPAGFTPGSGTIVNASTNPFNVTGLTHSTDYDFYLRDSCAVGDVSDWIGPVAGRTLCSITSAPWTEDFEGPAWVSADANPGSIDTCWSRSPGPLNTFFWQVGPLSFTPFGTGPSGDHTTGSGKYMFTRTFFVPTLPSTAEFVSPTIDLSALTIPELTFWYHMFGASIDPTGALIVDIHDGTTWNNAVYTLTGQQQSASADPWLEGIINLSAYANDTIQVRFRATKDVFGFQNMISIDDVDIHEQPSCPKPSNLSVSNSGATTIELSWTTGGATNWNIEYGPNGFTPGSGTIVNASSNPFTITGLTHSTNYDFYLRDSCAVGDVSDWIGPVTGRTLCAVTSAPWTEDFESIDWVYSDFAPGSIDTCWSRGPTPHNGFFWQAGPPSFPPFGTGPSGDHTTGSGKYAFTRTFGFPLALPRTVELVSPAIDLSALTIPELTFWYHMFGASIDPTGTLEVDIHDGSSWNNAVFTLTGQQQNASADPWIEGVVNLSAYANDTIQVRFRATKDIFGFQNMISIDDVDIHEQPSCPKPSFLSVSNRTATSIELSWTTGGATNWNIEYGPIGFTPGSGTIVNAASNPFTVTGLTHSTSYDFYLRDSCAVGDVSDWIGPIAGRTLCAVTSAPWTEDFESTDWVYANISPGSIDTCWSRGPTPNSGFFWQAGPPTFPPFGTGPSGDHTTGSGKYAFTRTFGFPLTLPKTVELVSPAIDLSTLTIPELTFWYHMFGASIDPTGTLEVDIHDGSTWTNAVFTLTGQQQTASADPWLEGVVNLSAYANDTIQVRFRATKDIFGFQNMISIDDIDIHEQPSCPKPQGLAVGFTTANTASLNWTTGGATNWNIEYGPSGFTPGTGTIVNASTNPFIVTGLNPSTTYDFYVRDSCGVGDVSVWVGPQTASTGCGVVPAPYTENFDNNTWIPGAGLTNLGNQINTCWTRNTLPGTYHWGTFTGATLSANTGPNTDNTTGSGKYIYTEASSLGVPATIESPEIDLSTLTVPELSFAYHMFGAAIGTLDVDIFDGSVWTNGVFTLTGFQQSAATDPWLTAIVNLSAYAGDTIKIRFTGTRGANFTGDIAVDDVDVHEQPSCPLPSLLSVSNRTATSIELSWTTGGATNWNIEYGPIGFTPGSGTIVNAPTNPFTVTGLTHSTNYDFYLRDSCGVGDVSGWIGPVEGRTLCSVTSAPWSEDFENTNWVPSDFSPGSIDTCWSRGPAPLTGFYWQVGPLSFAPFGTGPSGDHTTGTGQYMFTRTLGIAPPLPTTVEFVSPSIDLSALTIPELTFWYHMFGANIDPTGTLEVDIHDGTSWTNAVFTLTGQQQTASADPWLEATVNISAYANDTIQVRFRATKDVFGFQNMISIDDVDIHEQPNCPKPSGLTVTTVTSNSATLSWTTGGATNWQVEYGPAGFTPGTGTLINAGTNPFVVTGLNASTAYDFYVRDSCGAGDVSPWLGPETGTTSCTVVSAPWTENFDNTTWVVGTGFTNLGNLINDCWTRNTLPGVYHWGTMTAATPSANTGPSSDNTSGTGKYIYTEATSAGISATIESPSIDLSGLSNPRLSFAYHMFGTGMGNLDVDIYDGSTWTNSVHTLTGAQHNLTTDPWLIDTVDLSGFVNDTIIVRFTATRGINFMSDMAVDDVNIFDLTTCPAPTNLQAQGITSTSVDFTFVSPGSNSNISWGAPGFNPGPSSNYIANVLSSPYAQTGLTPNTNYEFYVRDSCAVGSVSAWVGPIAFTTLPCPTVTAAFTITTNGLNVHVDGNTSSGGTAWDWDFDDGSTGIGDTLSHSYSADGTYDIQLIHSSGCDTDTITISVDVCGPMTGAYTFTSTYLAVNFNASSSTGTPVSWDWNFGDGSPADTGQTTSHTYPGDGTYNASLIVTNLCGETDTVTQGVTVCDTLEANINSTQTGLSFTFDGSGSSAGAVNYYWYTGDGNIDTGQVTNHNYASTGFYTVSLVIENICGETDSISINVTACSKPTASWTYTIISSGSTGMQVQFDGSASVGAVNYSWDFGDGNTNNTSALPIHTYTVPGLFYEVCLIVENICGDTDTSCFKLNEIGIDEWKMLNDNLKVYPNPARESVHLELQQVNGTYEVELISMAGSRVYSKEVETEFGEFKHEIDVSTYPKGAYFISIRTPDGTLRRKLIVD